MTTAIDLFAGLGGWTCAAEMAGVRVLWAANHSRRAVHYHALNHRETVHACQDLQQADFRDAPRHDVLLASPSCTGHTKARGKDAPHHDAARATAWAVVTCAEVHRPPLVIVENVTEFLAWVLYPAWEAAMKALGYAVSPHTIDAADHGVAQNRVRVFIVCTRTRAPLVMSLDSEPLIAADSVIRWDRYAWSPVAKAHRSLWTLRQIEHGRSLGHRRFVLPYFKSARQGKTPMIREVTRPFGTLTTLDRYGLVDGDRMRMLHFEEAREVMGFPADTILPMEQRAAMHLLGNAIVPRVGMKVLSAAMAAA